MAEAIDCVVGDVAHELKKALLLAYNGGAVAINGDMTAIGQIHALRPKKPIGGQPGVNNSYMKP